MGKMLLFVILSFPALAAAQGGRNFTLLFKSGPVRYAENLPGVFRRPVPQGPGGLREANPGKALAPAFDRDIFAEKYYVLMQFTGLPDRSHIGRLRSCGVRLLAYLPHSSYLVSLPAHLNPQQLSGLPIRGIYSILPEQKMDARLRHGTNEEFEVIVSYVADLAEGQVSRALAAIPGVRLLGRDAGGQTVKVRLAARQLPALLRLPFVTFVEPAPPPPQPDNYRQGQATRSEYVTNAAGSRPALNGEGVRIGLGDTGFVEHLDFIGRLENLSKTSYGDHAVHTAGTIAGGGLIDVRYQGIAPKAFVVVDLFDQILADADEDTSIVMTSNSWNASGRSCEDFGVYNADSRGVDRRLLARKNLLHVFSAGNNNWTCPDQPSGYGDLNGGYASAKNLLTVGATSTRLRNDLPWSKGPTKDGRLKPEVIANGDVISTLPENTYGPKQGTSMSTPAAAGVLALMVQRYRQLQGGADPSGALLKAILCNTADDPYNPGDIYNENPPGPDFAAGFGFINARRAIEALDARRYLCDSLAQGEVKQHQIQVSQRGKSVKFMLYWHDPPAAAGAGRALVNNLDLRLLHNGQTVHPLVPDPANPLSPAAQGIDSLNNIEQIVISPAEAGSYLLEVSGTEVPFGPQPYFLTYTVVDDSLRLSFPAGGESLAPGSTEYILWEEHSNLQGFVTISFSGDGGGRWSEIGVAGAHPGGGYSWTVPDTITSQAMVRLSSGRSVSTSKPFSIMPMPAHLAVDWIQADALQLSWAAQAHAARYIVYMLAEGRVVSIGETAESRFVVREDNPAVGHLSGEHWFALSGVAADGARSRRTPALPVVVNDLDVALVRPAAAYTLRRGPLAVGVENRGLRPLHDLRLFWTIDFVDTNTTALAGALAPGEKVNFTLTDSLPAGPYSSVKCWAILAGDTDPANNLLYLEIDDSVRTITPGKPFVATFDDGTAFLQETLRDSLDWQQVAASPEAYTGARADHTSGAGKFFIFDYIHAGDRATAMLKSPTLDIFALTKPAISFWYDMHDDYGLTGTLNLEIQVDGVWKRLWARSGEQGTGWQQASFPLDGVKSRYVKLRFTAIGTYPRQSGISLDDVSVSESVASGIANAALPESPALHQNFPNPFNPGTVIRYDLPRAGRVQLAIYTLLGRRLRTLVDGREEAGFKKISWDGRDDAGVPAATGVYLYVLEIENFRQSRKMILLH